MLSNKKAVRSLWSAVCKGELEKVRELIDKNCGSPDSLTKSEEYDILCIAVQRKHTAITKLLLTKGFQVTSKNKIISGTLLFYAIKNGDTEILGLLLDRGVDINLSTRDSVSPFDIAIINKKKEIIDLLLHREACFADISKNGATLLIIAAESGHLQVVERLLNCGVSVDCQSGSTFKSRYTPLCFAIESGNEEIVKLLLSRGANSNVKLNGNKTPLHIAVDGGHIQIVELLLQHGAFVDAEDTDGKSAAFYAIINDADLKIIQLFLSNKANVKDYPDLLCDAVKKENIKMVDILSQYSVDINARNKCGTTALHLIASSKQKLKKDPDVKAEIAKLLLSRGANVNAQTKLETPLIAAVKKKNVKVIEALLEYNADVNIARSDNNRAPLHTCAYQGDELIIKMFLSKGANIDARDDRGTTPLQIASSFGNDGVVELLLRSGAKPDLRMRGEFTALQLAARRGHIEIVKILLKFGADIDAFDEYHGTSLMVGCIYQNNRLCIALLKYGADINILPIINENLIQGLFGDNEIAATFQHHLVKMKTANLYITKEYLPLVSIIIDKLSDFRHACEKEIANMKSEKIDNGVSFYDILTEDITGLGRFVENENIAQVFTSNDYIKKFPLYASLIESNFRKGKRRKELLEEGHTCFHFLLNSFPEFPRHCADKIFSYLSNVDLKFLVEACKSDASSSNADYIQYYKK